MFILYYESNNQNLQIMILAECLRKIILDFKDRSY